MERLLPRPMGFLQLEKYLATNPPQPRSPLNPQHRTPIRYHQQTQNRRIPTPKRYHNLRRLHSPHVPQAMPRTFR